MEAYRKEIKKRAISGSILAGGLLLLFFAAKAAGLLPIADGAHADYLLGFQYGALSGLEAVIIVRTVNCFLLLRRENKLEQLRIREKDERNQAIAMQSCKTTVTITLIGLAVALLACASYSFLATKLLTAATVLYILIYIGTIFYYSKKL